MRYQACTRAGVGRSGARRGIAAGILGVSIATLGACGGASNPASTPAAVEHTAVTLLVSSTANDRLSTFKATFASITLTSQSGTTVTLLLPGAR